MSGMTTMVTIVLKREWTDNAGIGHPSGAVVRVPETQLDELVTTGVVVTDASESWVTCD